MDKQVVQFFQLSIDDLEAMISGAVKSAIPPLTAVNNKFIRIENDSEPENDLITPKEVCKALKISNSTLWRYDAVTGILKPKVRIGRKVFYSKKDVSNFLNNNTL